MPLVRPLMMSQRAPGRWQRLARAVTLVAIALQVVLTSLVPLADAVIAARATSVSASQAAHAHDTPGTTQSSAPSTHCVEHCAFCQLIATCAELPGVPARASSGAATGQAIALERSRGARPVRSTALPRAPPVG